MAILSEWWSGLSISMNLEGFHHMLKHSPGVDDTQQMPFYCNEQDFNVY